MALYKKCLVIVGVMVASVMMTTPAMAEPKKETVYSEQEFLRAFSNKTRDEVAKQLGQPVKKEQSVKPSNASNVLGRPVDSKGKPDQVEMWYYKDIVRYDEKRTYKSIELVFVNDRCVNVAFFNSK
ncbi:hypothetical protein [Methylobacillus sp.]|uniref:hypothetical protein n=1 Tax=Methylobacillus sp. TaxID=56818 RepID=UPI002FE1884E